MSAIHNARNSGSIPSPSRISHFAQNTQFTGPLGTPYHTMSGEVGGFFSFWDYRPDSQDTDSGYIPAMELPVGGDAHQLTFRASILWPGNDGAPFPDACAFNECGGIVFVLINYP